MPSKLMEALKLAAKWLQIEGVEGVSANEDEDCLVVFISDDYNTNINTLPNRFHGFRISIIKND